MVLKSEASLENQRERLGAYLKNANVPSSFNAMIWELIKLYAKYQNDYVKHDNKVEQEDVNTIVLSQCYVYSQVVKNTGVVDYLQMNRSNQP